MHLQEAKNQLDNLTGQSTRSSGLMAKDVILFNALIAIAEQLEQFNEKLKRVAPEDSLFIILENK